MPVVNEGMVFYPGEGEIIYGGTDYIIRWDAPLARQVDIVLLREQEKDLIQVLEIAGASPNSGSYTWQVPEAIPEGRGYAIRIDGTGEKAGSILSGSLIIRRPGETSFYTDHRDGQTYAIIKMADRWWMAENFNLDTPGSYCYNDDGELCREYGRLYTHEAAMEYAPEGWHLPSDREWKELEQFLGLPAGEAGRSGSRGRFTGKLLVEGGGSGFNARYGGYFSKCKNASNHLRYEADFWTSNLAGDGNPIFRIIIAGSGGVIRTWGGCQAACSVRYIRDAGPLPTTGS